MHKSFEPPRSYSLPPLRVPCQRRRRKQLLDDLKEMIGYWKLKEEELYRTVWRNRFGRSYGSVVKQTTDDEWRNEWTPSAKRIERTTRVLRSLRIKSRICARCDCIAMTRIGNSSYLSVCSVLILSGYFICVNTFRQFSDLYLLFDHYKHNPVNNTNYTYIRTYIYQSIYTHTYIHIYLHVCAYTYTYIFTRIYIHRHTHTYIQAYIYTCNLYIKHTMTGNKIMCGYNVLYTLIYAQILYLRIWNTTKWR